MSATAIAGQGDTVDLICWRHYGRAAGVTEQVLAANPGVAALGPVLPMGTRLTLPDIPAAAAATLIKLWE